MTERLLANLHTLVALGYLAVLIHLTIYLKRFHGRPLGSIPAFSHLLVLFALATNLIGWKIYIVYRQTIKRELALSPLRWVPNLFDVKEHLGFFALVISLGLWVWVQLQRRLDAESQQRLSPAPLVWLNLALVALIALIGMLTATYRNF